MTPRLAAVVFITLMEETAVLRRVSIMLTILAAALAMPGIAAAADESAADKLAGDEIFESADEGTVEVVDDDGNPPIANRPREPNGSGSGGYKVCAPNGKKCVVVPYKEYCRLANGCGKPLYERINGGGCTSSTGCFYVKGKYYRYVGRPADRGDGNRGAKCAANLGFTQIAAMVSRGPAGLVVGGVALALWGC